MLIGVDLKKDARASWTPPTTTAAGVNAAFNLNLLDRINRELDGDIDIERFAHVAFYNEAEGRIEIYIEEPRRADASRSPAAVSHFAEGELIHTENSYKYAIDEFARSPRRAGFARSIPGPIPSALFSVHYLRQQ